MKMGSPVQDDLAKLSEESIAMLSKEYLTLKYCPEHGISLSDLFAKTTPFHDNVTKLREMELMLAGIPIKSAPGPRVTIPWRGKDKMMRMFASNDYLNLSGDKRVHQAIVDALPKFGVGA